MSRPSASPDPAALLDVACSITGRRWTGPDRGTERAALAIAQGTGLPDLVSRILARRGVAPEDAAAFLAPSLRDLTPDPSGLLDMDKAAERFSAAVERGERIAVFADYDVDGGASAALLTDWLRHAGLTATLYVPDRIREGYGPNAPAMRQLGQTHDLIVCVDCGTLAFGPVAAAGCDVIILDHHLGGETLPEALAVVNPNRADESGDLSYLCAAGVVFLLLVAVNRLRRARGLPVPDLMGMLDLVALATVADVAPLVGFNRALVRQGLKVMQRARRPGLQALASVAKLRDVPDTYTLGFLFGPRINAGGRVGEADTGARLLGTDCQAEASALAGRLETANTERRGVEAEVLAAARAQIGGAEPEGPLVWAAGDGWHPGVLGIVAARLKEKYGRPAVVVGFDGEEGKGSARSVSGVDLGANIARLVDEGYLSKGGGHRMAAGLSVEKHRFGPAMQRLCQLLKEEASSGRTEGESLEIDGMLSVGGASPELVGEIESAGPYGAGARAPRVAVGNVMIRHARQVGENHLALTLGDATGARLEAIAFRAFDGPLGEALCNAGRTPMHFVGQLKCDRWAGRVRVKLHVEDAAPADNFSQHR